MHHRFKPALLAGLLAAAPVAGAAQPETAYPTKPIRLIIPFAPGGGTDITARVLAQKLTEALGQTVVADNRAGANGTIGAELAAKSPPDGYTISMISSSHSVNPSLMRKLQYDLISDLAPITQATTQPYALVVNPGVPAKSVQELIALAKAKPGALNYGSSGTGGLSHLSGALFGALAGIDIHHVPYKGGAPALTDVISGQIEMLYSTILQASPHLKSGRLRALAVTTAKRSQSMPELPTMAQAGVPGYEVAGWYGVVAPAKTPRPVIVRLNQEMVRALKMPDVAEKLAADGSEPVGSTPEAFGAHIRAEVAKWRKLIQQVGIRAE
jgi:tripartite-type tricarboxylate transporter receptor subunit TctC